MTSIPFDQDSTSRFAPKFVIRLPGVLNDAVADLAHRNYRSMNSEILKAIESWLLNKGHMTLFQNLLVERVGIEKFAEIHNREREFRTGEIKKFVVRLLPGMRESISEQKILSKNPMNEIFLQILNWWVTLNEDMTELFCVYSESRGDAASAFDLTSLIKAA